MFTGLTECMAEITGKSALASGTRFQISHAFSDLSLGESISVSGACLTVVRFDATSFEADVSPETLRITTLGGLELGQSVNLERSLKAGARLGGHLVAGHVDGVATVASTKTLGDMTLVSLELPAALLRYVAKKGSLTVDGVSLTVNETTESGAELLIIPHTQKVTTLGALSAGTRVNVEVDLVARYVERLLSAGQPS